MEFDHLASVEGRPRGWRDAIWAALVVSGLAVIALLLYEPFRSRPFSILDFSEFLPLLEANGSTADRVRALVRYYATRGRFNPIAYVVLAVKWEWFGSNSVAWQLLRYAQMTALVLSVLVFLRRIGSTRAASAVGAALFVVSGSAAQGWVRLTMGEVLGSELVVLALLYGLSYQRTSNWMRATAMFGCVIVALLLVKEMFLAAVPLIVLFALCWNGRGALVVPNVSPRNVALVTVALAASASALAPVAYVALTSSPGAYTQSFGTSGIPILRLVVWLGGAITPYLVMSWRSPPWALAHLLAFLGLLWVGWIAARHSTLRRHYAVLAVIFGLHIAAALILYLPWPVYQPFYAMPFLISEATVVAALLTAGQQGFPSRSRYLVLGWVGVLCAAGMQALDYRRAADAQQRFHAELVSTLAQLTADTVVVANKKAPKGDRAWQGFGSTLARYGTAVSLQLPIIVDQNCEEARSHIQGHESSHDGGSSALQKVAAAQRVVIRDGNTCEVLGLPSNQLVRRYSRFDWDTLRSVVDSFYVSFYQSASLTNADTNQPPVRH
jgi:hypothetical protein